MTDHDIRTSEVSAARHAATVTDGGQERTTSDLSDTSTDVSAKQFEVLHRMGLEGRARLTFSLMNNATELALAGIRAREPRVSVERERWLLMVRRYGRELALAVLGDEPPRR